MLEFIHDIIGVGARIILGLNILLLIKSLKVRPELKWFCLLLVWGFLIQSVAPNYGKLLGNNLPLLHLYTFFEFIFISIFYRKILLKNYPQNRYFPYFVGIISLLIVANSVFLEPITVFNSNAKGLTQTIIISYAIVYFFNRISVDEVKKNLVLNRINAAILLYYAGSLFIFIFAEFLKENSLTMNQYFWNFNALLYLIFQVLILIATWHLVFPSTKEIKSED